ncbi:MAG: DNA polymerase III subunit delta [Acidobacteria bacterium]|nr:DNA polymerase III subunit delta [Acidobacteriota bacterium]
MSTTAALSVYLVRGDDPTLRSEAARSLIHQLVGDADATLTVEEHEPAGDDADTAAIADAAQTPPFLSERRVVVARDIGAYSSEALGPLLTYLEDPLDTTTLVLVAGEKKPGTKLVNAVKKAGHVVEAGPPAQRAGRGAWLAEQLRASPVRLEPSAAALLDGHLGEDLGRLTNLLQALAAAYGSGAKISVADLEPFLGEAGNVPPWDLTDAIDAGRTADALSALQRMMGAGERHPLQLLAALHGHYGRMLRLDGAGIADEATAAQALGMKGSTFPAKKALTQSRRLGGDGVAEAIRLLAEADLDLRGFERDWPDSLVMEVLVARLSRLGPRARR